MKCQQNLVINADVWYMHYRKIRPMIPKLLLSLIEIRLYRPTAIDSQYVSRAFTLCRAADYSSGDSIPGVTCDTGFFFHITR